MNNNIEVCRDENLLEKVVLVDGQAGCGKTMLTSLISSFNRVEIFNYAPEIENICILEHLDKISEDASETMIKVQMDLCLYETMMSRRINFRYNDLSSAFNSSKFFKYFKRLFDKGDEIIPSRLKKEKPILNYAVHNLLSYSKPLFRALDNKFLIIELIRHPLYMIIQNTINYINIGAKNGLARQFRINLKNNSKQFPYQFHENGDLYNDLTPCERAIFDIDFFTKRTKIFKDKLSIKESKNVLTIPFEHFVLSPNLYIESILSTLGTTQTPQTKKLLKKHKVPRKKISDGLSLNVYKRFGWAPPIENFTEKDELNKRRNFVIKEGVKDYYLNLLDQHCIEYENKFFKDIL